ncbi:spindle and centriole-associated protein 1 isoform 2-T2 [Aulostomus maculatus]
MSSVRAGRPQQHTKGRRTVRPKKTAAPKKDWVSTVNDLSVHKLTPAELNYRHEIHKSHNKAAAQWELREQALRSRLGHKSPARLDQASLTIFREVFSDQLLLQDVLARSDRAMAVVKDLFGDAPRRQTGHPSVTMAPNHDSDSMLPVLQRPDPPTQLSLLSQSMMDQQALNEVEDSEEDHSDEDTGSPDYTIIQRSNVRKMRAKTQGRVLMQQGVNHHISELRPRDNGPVTPCASGRAPEQAALNATVAVRRLHSRQSQAEDATEEPSVLVSQVLNPELPLNQTDQISKRANRKKKHVSRNSELDAPSVTYLSGDTSSLGLLQTMLGQVEDDLDALTPETEPALSSHQHKTQGLTGFSIALVSTLGRLVHLLKQREQEAQSEAEERRQLEETLKEQRALIDALTAETMALREEATSLQSELQQRTTELEQKLDTVVSAMGGLGLLGTQIYSAQGSGVKAADYPPVPVPEQVSVSPAVLLSPPRQTVNWQQIPDTHPVRLQQEHPPVDIMCSLDKLKAHSSASSLTSLPLTSLPSTSSLSLTSDTVSSQPCAEVMLAEIAQLGRQNEMIRAQLSQAKRMESGLEGSLNSTGELRLLSSSNTGRITPRSVVERMVPGSSSTERLSPHIQPAEAEKMTNKGTSHVTLSVSNVQERLLELNRQSAAARGRLLDLIEQQKQSVSANVSPSASPIPSSAFSSHPAAVGSPELSILVPAEEPLSKASGGERRSVSSLSTGGETRDSKTQADKRREREGWFALSSHVR